MRIKKTAQTTTTQAQISDGYSTSKIDGYSCNYVNNALKDVYSTTETKTNKVWTDGKPIYRTVISKSVSSGTNNITLSDYGISNYDTIYINYNGSYIKNSSGEIKHLSTYESSQAFNNTTLKTSTGVFTYYTNSSFLGGTINLIVEYTKSS